MNYKELMQFLMKFGFKIFPVRYKEPIDSESWKRWIKLEQDDVATKYFMKVEKNATGFAVISTKRLVILDLDKVKSYAFVEVVLGSLGLPKDYKWLIKSGSGEGYHIYLNIYDHYNLSNYFGNGSYINYFPISNGTCKKMEVRIKNCYVVSPFSKHERGGFYEFVNGIPDTAPLTLKSDTLSGMVCSYFDLRFHKANRKNEYRSYEHDHSFLEEILLKIREYYIDYLTWIKICYALCNLGENGRKYFQLVSDNEYWEEDTPEYIDSVFDECLKRYDDIRINQGSIYYLAKVKYGIKLNFRTRNMSRQGIEFELILLSLSYSPQIKLKKILNYYLVGLAKKRDAEKPDIAGVYKEYSIPMDSEAESIGDYDECRNIVSEFKEKFGPDAFCRIGKEFFLETMIGANDYRLLSVQGAIVAIQSKTKQYKKISLDRIRYAQSGYKSRVVFNELNGNEDTLLSRSQMRTVIKKLSKREFISRISEGRRSYFSTFLPESKLRRILIKKNEIGKVKAKV